MTTLYIAIGLPGSGKTTEGERWFDADPWRRCLVSRDDLRHLALRRDRSGVRALATEAEPRGHDDAEDLVTHMQQLVLRVALSARRDVFVHDTNLVPGRRDALAAVAGRYAHRVRCVDFTTVPLAECLRRNALRPAPVPEDVIVRMHDEWVENGAALEGLEAARLIPWGEFRTGAGRDAARR